ncbi:MAG: hypothetical protein EH225_02105 [Calditrichaeota bacterium]|nr:hypothetical protein [Calditrichota bacterium]RQW07300.1 MAG: hypothetical protein EH225_02105 [Calditrichota bacterium]
MKALGLLIITLLVFSSYGQLTMIKNVPDYSQPPQKTLPSTIDSNYCAPFAFLNIVAYWELIQSHPNAQGMLGGLVPGVAVEYIGWFMDTNNQGSPSRMNDNGLPAAMGTYAIDQWQGIIDYVAFNSSNPLGFPWTVPPGKTAYSWDIQEFPVDMFPEFEREINDGNPVKLDFLHWNIIPTGDTLIDPGPPADTIFIYRWGPVEPTSAFNPEAPWEEWNLETGENSIGHSVTGVGYIIDTLQFAIVHDNWANTPENVAIPWNHPTLPMQMVSYMIFVHVPPVNILNDEPSGHGKTFHLMQNYPNPFNANTKIEFRIPNSGFVTLRIYNTAGE